MIAKPLWTAKTYLSNYDEYIFYRAIGEPLGVTYEPIAVAERPTRGGVEYRFIAKVTPATYPPESFFATVDIFSPRNGAPRVMMITQLLD